MLRAQFRVAHRVRDVFMPEVILDGSSIVTLLANLYTSACLSIWGWTGKGNLASSPARDPRTRRRRRHGSASLGHE